jgi:hypothetical protein
MTKLVRYDAMCRAIEAAHAVDEVKDIRDRAVALEHYARQAQNTDAERRACEIRLRAERKAGQLLAELPKQQGSRGVGKKVGSTDTTPLQKALKTNGISKDQSSQWQKLGAMPQKQFELAIGESVKPPTTKGVLRAAEAETKPRQTVASEALWLWGRLLDFERDGLLDKTPADVLETMTDPMLDDVHRLAPKVAAWLKRIGALS